MYGFQTKIFLPKIRWVIRSHDTSLTISITAISVWKANKSRTGHCRPQHTLFALKMLTTYKKVFPKLESIISLFWFILVHEGMHYFRCYIYILCQNENLNTMKCVKSLHVKIYVNIWLCCHETIWHCVMKKYVMEIGMIISFIIKELYHVLFHKYWTRLVRWQTK